MAKLMVVDDIEGVSRSIQKVLTKAGHNVCVCNNGDEAIKCFSNESFDLIISDILMPQKDGLELAKFIRNHSDPQKNKTSILAMTGGGTLVTKEMAKEAIVEYADLVLSKPFDSNTIISAVNQCLEGTE